MKAHPERREQMMENMRRWRQLTPEQRERVRERMRERRRP
jgi:PHD/YefM family antitoxin component YafN of YafNO toxin-antitoxin module